MTDKASVLIFYHYFHPDDVVSARLYSELAQDLDEAGFSVEVITSNRSRSGEQDYPSNGLLGGVQIRRLYRPDLDQGRLLGRVINAVWMITCWSFFALFRKPDVVIVGTDPILSVVISIPWKMVKPKTRLVHWCFDVYPDAAIAAGILERTSFLARLCQRLAEISYRRFDVIVDIGRCMRDRLPENRAQRLTLTPWALAEPEHPLPIDWEEREKIFGETELAILYSGNFGEAHAYKNVLSLARRLRGKAVIVFSIRGDRVEELKRAIEPEDTNIRFVDFADEAHLEKRLACADLHLVTLSDNWQGIVVPSKFFGALAIGRPVLFDGPEDSAVSGWIEEHSVGHRLSDELTDIVISKDFHRAHDVYRRSFSRRTQTGHWIELLNRLTSSDS